MIKIFFTLTFLFSVLFSFSQSKLEISINENERLEQTQLSSENGFEKSISQTENQSPFEALIGKTEDLAKRDAFSKHYRNNDGSYTAIISAGPMHYLNKDTRKWEEISNKISETSNLDYKFANTSNTIESHFGTRLQNGVISKIEGGVITEFLNPKMYWEVNGKGTQLQKANNSTVSINEDKAVYKNIFGDISVEYTVLTGKRELNYIIPSLKALGDIPSQTEYLVFTEDIELPENWTAIMEERQGIVIKNQFGKEVCVYENPYSTDAESMDKIEENTIYEIVENGNIITIKTKIKTDWLLSKERVFPVKVDPTVNAIADAGRSVYSDGYGGTTGQWGSRSGYWLSYHIKFNTSSIPVNSTINSVTGYHYVAQYGGTVHSGNAWQWANSANPATTSGSALYNSANLGYSNIMAISQYSGGWNSSTFYNPEGNTYVQNSNNSNGFVCAAVVCAGTFNSNNYYASRTHNDTEKPYLSITYTEPTGPPSCVTGFIVPVNGSMGLAYQGQLIWAEQAGVTGYDVYLGTNIDPPLVSSNQAGTKYTVTDCLLPNTTYYWKVAPRNANGPAVGCPIWSFTTDNKIIVYRTDFEDATTGIFGVSGPAFDNWYTNTHEGVYDSYYNYYSNIWSVSTGTYAISGQSAGVSALYNGALAGQFFQYWSDLGIIYRWIYRPFNCTALRDIEVNFRWRCGGENGQDYGTVCSSINGGANWYTETQGGLYGDGKYWGSPNTVQTQSLILPSSRNNLNNVIIAFKWNDLSGNGYSTDPSFVIDDLYVKGCPYEGMIRSDKVASGVFEWAPSGSTQTTLTVEGSHACAQYQWEQSVDLGATWSIIPGATSVQYTTPPDLISTTYYRCRVYFSTGCLGIYQDEAFKILDDNLPVTLLSFTSECEKDKINFAWSTASEINSDYFEIIETMDFKNFNILAKIPAAGFSSSVVNYEYQAEANQGKTYYQLKQYDFDGKWEMLSTIVANCEENIDKEIYVYPIPANESINILFPTDYIDVRISIIDITGKQILTKDIGNIPQGEIINLPASHFPKGTYTLNIISKYSSQAKLIVIN